MITIPKKVEYSIIFLSYLSKNKDKISSLTEASKKLLLPYRFLGQLAAELRTAGIVTSKEGKTGGYSLASGWEKNSLYDLIEALGENKHVVKCMVSGHECKREDVCEMKKVWGKIENSLTNELKKIKLSEV